MNIAEIKRLAKSHSLEELIKTENALINENITAINVNGADDGERLTHVMAAIFIIERMNSGNIDVNGALREYTAKVRTSIS